MPIESPASQAVPPPFDVAPAPDPVAPRDPVPSRRAPAPRAPDPIPRLVLFLSVGVLLAGAGFVAGASISRSFGGSADRLSPDPAPEARRADAPSPADAVRPPEPPPVFERRDHPLDVARERLEEGDVIGARRAATDFLLVRDGLSEAERRRTSQAYALLADSIRAELERARGAGRRP